MVLVESSIIVTEAVVIELSLSISTGELVVKVSLEMVLAPVPLVTSSSFATVKT